MTANKTLREDLETRVNQTSKEVAELTRIAKQNHADMRDFITSVGTKLDLIIARLGVSTDDPSTGVFVEFTAVNIDKEYKKSDRLRLLCKKRFSTESMLVSRMLPTLSKERPEGIPSPLFMTAEPIRQGAGGCYVYLHTIVDNKMQRAQIEQFLQDKKVGINFLVYYTKRK